LNPSTHPIYAPGPHSLPVLSRSLLPGGLLLATGTGSSGCFLSCAPSWQSPAAGASGRRRGNG